MTQRHWMYDMRVKLKYCLIMMRRGGLNGCSCRTEKRTFALLDNGTAGLSSQWITVRQRDFRVQISHNSLCRLAGCASSTHADESVDSKVLVSDSARCRAPVSALTFTRLD
jgi:hypothetical protein